MSGPRCPAALHPSPPHRAVAGRLHAPPAVPSALRVLPQPQRRRPRAGGPRASWGALLSLSVLFRASSFRCCDFRYIFQSGLYRPKSNHHQNFVYHRMISIFVLDLLDFLIFPLPLCYLRHHTVPSAPVPVPARRWCRHECLFGPPPDAGPFPPRPSDPIIRAPTSAPSPLSPPPDPALPSRCEFTPPQLTAPPRSFAAYFFERISHLYANTSICVPITSERDPAAVLPKNMHSTQFRLIPYF